LTPLFLNDFATGSLSGTARCDLGHDIKARAQSKHNERQGSNRVECGAHKNVSVTLPDYREGY
jgi:hypothetical protein